MSFKDLYQRGHLMSFKQLRNKYDLLATDLFRYLQIWSFIKSHISTFADMPQHGGMSANVNKMYCRVKTLCNTSESIRIKLALLHTNSGHAPASTHSVPQYLYLTSNGSLNPSWSFWGLRVTMLWWCFIDHNHCDFHGNFENVCCRCC